MRVELSWKDWIIPFFIIGICFIGLPLGLKGYAVWRSDQFKQGIVDFAPAIMAQSRASFDLVLRIVAATAYQPIREGEEWYGPKEETVQTAKTACHTLVEAALKANRRYYLDERDCGIFFQKGTEWIMVNADVYKPRSNEFFMENILKLQASNETWRMDSFGGYYKVTYKLQTNPDAFVDIMVRRREY